LGAKDRTANAKNGKPFCDIFTFHKADPSLWKLVEPQVKKLRTLLWSVLLVPIVFMYDPAKPEMSPIASLDEAVTTASENIVSNIRTGRHLGFDTYAYPGDDAMLAWRDEDVPYEWVGYYLPAPCHKSESWSGKRETLAGMGWGMAVIYVGQQVWNGVPGRPVVKTKYVTKRVKATVRRNGHRVTRYVRKRVPVRVVIQPRVQRGTSCGTQLVGAPRGAMEARDAAQQAESEGFPRGSVIFLDIERMDKVPSRMRDYYVAWTKGVLADGRYKPGFYVHDHNAKIVFNDVAGVYLNAGLRESPAFWVAGARGFSEDKAPHEVGHSFANVWQGMLDVVQTHNGVKLPIDVNVSSVPSPSTFGVLATD
jgi:glycoside hydrolase-like protein